MTIERQPLSSLTERVGLAFREAEFGRTEFEDGCARRGDLIIYAPAQGKNSYVGSVGVDDIFDANGNRFYQD